MSIKYKDYQVLAFLIDLLLQSRQMPKIKSQSDFQEVRLGNRVNTKFVNVDISDAAK